jgi:hypothetical protein
MGLGPVNAALTRSTLGWLRRRAHPAAEFRRLVALSAFSRENGAEITADGLALEVRLRA